MNYLVFLDAQAGELEKILSGTKSMLLKELHPAGGADCTVSPGDQLYFLRNSGDCDPQVKAIVSRVFAYTKLMDEDLSNILKEMQPRLQLTEDQYNNWSVKGQFVLVEFAGAHKIGTIHIMQEKIKEQRDWIPFEELDKIT